MNLRAYIEKLGEIEDETKFLSKHLEMEVEAYKAKDVYGISFENDRGEIPYCEEFETIEELANQIHAICIGLMLAKGMEI